MTIMKTNNGFPIDKTDEWEARVGKSKQKKEQNPQWAKIKDSYMISPIYGGNGRVLVQEDPFKSKYDCSACEGKGHTDEICPTCNGSKMISRVIKKSLIKDKWVEDIVSDPCIDCRPQNNDQLSAVNKSYGFKLCTVCNGKQGLIITPEDSQKNATTGNVLAVSNRNILEVKTGNKVIFTNYSGSPFKIAEVELRIIIERDLLGIVKILKKGVDSMNEGTFADIANAGLVR